MSLVSSPGSGKTTFLEKTLTQLQPRYRVAALVGDLATENDALRLARSKAPVKQITTGTLCHLEAAMVQNALQEWDLNELDFLFIENVGNLVCPSSYDLGENLRLVLMSVTEGEDKPLKYPTIFNSADVAVVTKNELATAVEFDWETARRSIESVPARHADFSPLRENGRGYANLSGLPGGTIEGTSRGRTHVAGRTRSALGHLGQGHQGSCCVRDEQGEHACHDQLTIARLHQIGEHTRNKQKKKRNCGDEESFARDVRDAPSPKR